jgi:hypothetical protein
MRNLKSMACLGLMIVTTPDVLAAQFCVASSNALQAALTSAQANGQDDTIKIQTGSYSASSGANAFNFQTSESADLTIEGGYSTNCGRQFLNASSTVLSGSDARRVLRLYSDNNGAIRVSNLTIENGDSVSRGGGLEVSGPTTFPLQPYAGNVRVERVIFQYNHSSQAGGGLSISTAGNITVLGNLFVFNRCADNYCGFLLESRAVIATPGLTYFGGNTVAFNRCDLGVAGCDSYGGRLIGAQNATVYDNNFAFSGGVDLLVSAPAATAALYYNNIENLVGSATTSVGDVSFANPLFVDALAGDFRLQGNSPLRNLGNAPYPLPSVDLRGRPRIVESAPEIGAYEFQEFLLTDGFED